MDLAFMAVTGELFEAVAFCNAHPAAYLWMSLSGSFCFLGLRCVLPLVKHFGATATTVITTSIFLHFLLHTFCFFF